jgi:outer membrane biogenesis lipoprotein LolB
MKKVKFYNRLSVLIIAAFMLFTACSDDADKNTTNTTTKSDTIKCH